MFFYFIIKNLLDALSKSGVNKENIKSVFFGMALQSGIGQGPARIAAIKAGLPVTVNCTTVNKVCSSSMKAIHLGCQEIMLNYCNYCICGGMESMSNAPFLTPRHPPVGGYLVEDSLLSDGLMDSTCAKEERKHMGYLAEDYGNPSINKELKISISRQEQDTFAINSFKRANHAWAMGWFKDEVDKVDVKKVKDGREYTIFLEKDEQLKKVIHHCLSG
jgi:acetyl-CoA C-acetyltransferase